MCTLAIITRVLPGMPVVIAANRDEFYARPATEPLILHRDPTIVGGRDLQAGGTWLAVSEAGLVVGVLNRRSENPPDASRDSRGALCVELACERSAERAAHAAARVSPTRYNPFNLLMADRERAFVAQNRGDATFVQELAPGTHLLTNLNLNDPMCPRISRSAKHFEALAERLCDHGTTTSTLVPALRELLADHQTPLDDRHPTDQLCIHTPQFGTRSASIVLGRDDGALELFHAHGPPCQAAFRGVELPWSASAAT